MKKVITYGTYDLLHEGHIKLLERAKALGDYLIVGVTNDSFDRERGKLNVRNNVLERVEAVKATGIADQIVIEDYVGQKIDDIQKYGVDIFTVGSDWEGRFDYLKEYCNVVYLPRTEGISSTQLRADSQRYIRFGIIGCGRIAEKFVGESQYVSCSRVVAVYDCDSAKATEFASRHSVENIATTEEELINSVDAVYVATPSSSHLCLVEKALIAGKHVLCEIPMLTDSDEACRLFALAKEKKLVLMEALKTAYAPAYRHLIVMLKSGVIGDIVDVDSSISQLKAEDARELNNRLDGGCINEMAAYPLLPIFELLGAGFESIKFYSKLRNDVDVYTKGIMSYKNAVASFKIGMGVKTEGSLIVSGTNGYAYVPAPWWKMDYFELRFENQNENKKFFYRFEGDGLRYEIQEFVSCIVNHRIDSSRHPRKNVIEVARIIETFARRENVISI